MAQATWSSSMMRWSHVALIVSSFGVLTMLTVLIYLVFQMAAVAEVEAPQVLIRTHYRD